MMTPHTHKDIFSYLKHLRDPKLKRPFIFFIVLFLLLLGLGTWQIVRLDAKNALVRTMDQNLAQSPAELLSVIEAPTVLSHLLEYRPVSLQGNLEGELAFQLMSRVQEGENGYHVIVPVLLEGGERILVDMGWVPTSQSFKALKLPKGTVSLKGILLKGTGRNTFTPLNQYPNKILYSIDPKEMAKALQWPTLLPFYIIQTSTFEGKDGYPKPSKAIFTVRNFHLQYAITWYLLALIWGCIFALFVRQRVKEKESQPSPHEREE